MTKKKFEEIISDAIADLESCVKDEERHSKEPFMSDYERGCIEGRIDGYEKSIELLEFMKKVWAK